MSPSREPGKSHKSDKPEYLRTFERFWRPLLTTNGAIDMDKVARELADYHDMLEEVPKVYDHVTRGLISKPNTMARCVIAEADKVLDECIGEAVQEAREEWDDERAEPSPTGA